MQRAAMIGLGGIVVIPALVLAYLGRPQAPRPAAPGAAPPAAVSAPLAAASVPMASRPAAAPAASASAPTAAASGPAPTQVVAPAAASRAPSFDVVRVGAGGSAVIAGRAAPGAEVSLLLDGQREIGRTRADGRGEWVILPAPIAPGAWELSLRARLGTEASPGAETVVVIVPEPVRRAAPAEAPVAVLLPSAAPPRLLQAPSAEAAPGLAIGSVEQQADGDVRIAGAAPAGAALRVHLGDRHVADTTADAEGRWQVATSGGGQGTLRVDRIGEGGLVAARAEVPFTPVAAAPDGLGARRVVVERGTNLWRIARATYGQGPRYTVIYQANRGQIRDPGRIFPGQVLDVPGGQATPAASSESR
ncbi:LysM peptidoglycan-binding domain-containing protein [Roseomonas eburnea]|uniref:LysM peptidoglycan-binding domain-containing protein n=1 Tax=Neoroseomonas eburnea TaxID=1346889 RepID=A0A9X9XHL0_9PROT|nr:LysM peptidoglycan-binding domain-containing protein [Neoroseomonas eburnea]MBR0683196.1 LysM peptidoglycan-binding domain-containing protein [Neoroseomonas eburnea]